MRELQICYHGTSKENATSIQDKGFEKGSWFALSLQDALEFGGPYVFSVLFEKDLIPDSWQFFTPKSVAATRIISLNQYTEVELYENKALREKIFKSNIGG